MLMNPDTDKHEHQKQKSHGYGAIIGLGLALGAVFGIIFDNVGIIIVTSLALSSLLDKTFR